MSHTEDYHELQQRAFGLYQQGKLAEAGALFEELLRAYPFTVDFEYNRWLRACAACFEAEGQRTEAGLIYTYLNFTEIARERFEEAGDALDLAMLEERAGRPEQAARLYRKTGLPGAAAALEASRADAGAYPVRDHQQVLARMTPQTPPLLRTLAEVHLGRALLKAGLEVAARTLLSHSRERLIAWARDRRAAGQLSEAITAWRVLTVACQLLDDAEGTDKGYAWLAALHLEHQQPALAARYRETLTQRHLDRGELDQAARLLQETAERFVAEDQRLRATLLAEAAALLERLARRHTTPNRDDRLKAAQAWSRAAELYTKLHERARCARCYREIAALQITPEATERAWRQARDLRDQIGAEPLQRAHQRPPAIDLTDWFDHSIALLRIDELKGNLGWLLRALLWRQDQSDVSRRQLLTALFELLRDPTGQPTEQLLMRVAEAVAGLTHDAAVPVLEALMQQSPSEEVHAEVMRQSAALPTPEALAFLKRGLDDMRLNVRREAIESLTEHAAPEALAGLRELYLGCACVGGKAAVLDAMTRCGATPRQLARTLRTLPRDPRVEDAYQAALRATQGYR